MRRNIFLSYYYDYRGNLISQKIQKYFISKKRHISLNLLWFICSLELERDKTYKGILINCKINCSRKIIIIIIIWFFVLPPHHFQGLERNQFILVKILFFVKHYW